MLFARKASLHFAHKTRPVTRPMVLECRPHASLQTLVRSDAAGRAAPSSATSAETSGPSFEVASRSACSPGARSWVGSRRCTWWMGWGGWANSGTGMLTKPRLAHQSQVCSELKNHATSGWTHKLRSRCQVTKSQDLCLLFT